MAREKTLAHKERGEIEQYEPWNTFRDMERMFRDFFTAPFPLTPRLRPWLREYMPEVDLRETDQELILEAAVPGLRKEDIEIDVTKDHITLTGERKEEEEKPEETYHIRQRRYGQFKLSYTLPTEVKPDEVKATYKHGVLEIVLPKAEVTTPHKVKVETEG